MYKRPHFIELIKRNQKRFQDGKITRAGDVFFDFSPGEAPIGRPKRFPTGRFSSNQPK